MRVVLDTNIILVSIPRLSEYRQIFEALIQQKYTLVISNEILTEYEEIIAQKTTETVAQGFFSTVPKSPNPFPKLNSPLDPLS
jgi:predicted nucleic acid-binding protein